jgi:uncharacterized protein YdaU (DUF1376 family)
MSRPWYRRFPDNFIAGTVELSLEEKGAYSLVLDLMYVRGGPVPDEPRYIAGVCSCSVRKWNVIRARLLSLGKLRLVDGRLSNDRFERELENAVKDARERAESGRKGGAKSAEKRRERKTSNGLAPSELNHARAAQNQNQDSIYDKRLILSEEDSASGIQLDRWADEVLFTACERISGKTVPAYQQKKTFPRDVVDKAKAEQSGSVV